MTTGYAIARAAEALAGTPFRLQGRDPATGLDCVGLVACALRQAGLAPVPPEGYRLRTTSIARYLSFAEHSGLGETSHHAEEGDVVLVRPGPGQHHLCILLSGDRYAHAHAGLRKTVIAHGPPPWPAILRWRARNEETR